MHSVAGIDSNDTIEQLDVGTVSNRYVYLISVVAALGGLLFGFDTAVINGAIVFLRAEFGLSDVQTEIAASSILFGCVVGAMIAGTLSDKFGRKKTLLCAAAFFLLSSIGAAIPTDLTQFTIARFIGGVAIGVASMLSPLYIAEVSPAHLRGRLVTLSQMAIVTGILCAYVINWMLADLGINSWRWMFASAFIPSVLFMLSLFFVPESPRWLIKQNNREAALAILTKLIGRPAALTQMEDMGRALSLETQTATNLYQRKFRRPLFIAISLAILQQVTGINTILYYGSIILNDYTSSANSTAAIGANTIIGITNFVCTIIALGLIDRIGRKTLLMIASAGMCLSLILLGLTFSVKASNTLVLTCILFYVAFFAVGLGPGVWVLMAELFPTSIRGRAMSVATISLWSACTLISFTFLSLVNAITVAGAFWLYAGMSLLTFILVWRIVPETKGKSLEDIQRWWA
jgi:sugar porter (SP) family MFS transporter